MDRLRGLFEPDNRFRGLFLIGSFGRGAADGRSDVDTLLIVDQTVFAAVVQAWDTVSEPLGPFTFVKRIPGTSVFNHILPGWIRWDATLASSDTVPPLFQGRVNVVFDKDHRPLAPPPSADLDLDVARGVTVEFLRCLALLPVVAGRNDPVTGVSGVQLLRQLTIQLMRLVDDVGGTTGALHLRRSLSSEHYESLRCLPQVGADLVSVIEGHRALRDLFVPLAQSALGDRYPHEFARVALEHVLPLLDQPR